MIYTKPAVGHAIGVLTRFMENSEKQHQNITKWVPRYMQGTKKSNFDGDSTKLKGVDDFDLCGNFDLSRSNLGYINMIGETTVSCICQLQKGVFLSTIEVEYITSIDFSKEMVLQNGFLEQIYLESMLRVSIHHTFCMFIRYPNFPCLSPTTGFG